MTKRVCLEAGCPTLTNSTRCHDHTRERDRARGSSTARGYGADHRALGRRYQREMDAGRVFRCWRCGATLGTRRGSDWMLGHCDLDRSKYHGPECPPCDLATAGRVGCPHPDHGISPAA